MRMASEDRRQQLPWVVVSSLSAWFNASYIAPYALRREYQWFRSDYAPHS